MHPQTKTREQTTRDLPRQLLLWVLQTQVLARPPQSPAKEARRDYQTLEPQHRQRQARVRVQAACLQSLRIHWLSRAHFQIQVLPHRHQRLVLSEPADP